MYNNHKHTSTKFTPNEQFFTKDHKIFEEAKNNIKNSFKYIGKLFKTFKLKDLVLVNPRFIIKKKCINNKPGFLLFKRIKHRNIYNKINAMIINNEGSNYLIKIAKDYPMYEINKDELYYVSYKLIRKCSEETWKNLLNDNNKIFSFNTGDRK